MNDFDFPTLDVYPDELAKPPVPTGPGTKPSTALTLTETALEPLVRISADLRALAERYRDVAFDYRTPKGLEAAKAARHDLRENGRFAVQRACDKFKKDANAAKRAVDDMADSLIGIVKPREDELDAAIKAREDEIAAEKAEKARIEAARVAKHQAAIATIRNYVALANTPGMTAAKLTRGMVALQAMVFGEEFEEFADQAEAARDEALAALEVLHGTATLREAEAEAAERQRVENERVAAENRRIAAELAEQQRRLDAAAEVLRQQQEAADAARRAEEAAAQRRADEEAEARERAEHARLEAERIAELTKDAPKPGDDDPIDSPALVAESAPVVSAPAVMAAPEVKPVPADCVVVHGEVCMATGALCVRLGFVIGGERLKEWGFKPLTTAKGPGMYWRLSDLPGICDALIKRLQAVKGAL